LKQISGSAQIATSAYHLTSTPTSAPLNTQGLGYATAQGMLMVTP